MSPAPPLLSGGKPGLGHVLEFLRDPIGVLERGHREQGELFSLRLGNRDGVVMIGPEHNRFFFTEPESVLSIKTAYPYMEKMFDEGFYFFAEPEEYQRQQGLLISHFEGRHQDEQIGIMADETHAFLATLGNEGEFDLTARLGPLVMRIDAHAFLGRDLGLFLGYDFFGELRRFSDGMEPVLPPWLPLPRLIRSHRAKRRLHERLGELLKVRRENPVDPPDFLQTLVDARYLDGSTVPRSVVVNLVLMLMWTGEQTVTGHLSWAVIDLLRNPDYLASVLDEQQGVFGDGRDVTVERLARLGRLDRALRETERLHPVAHILQRTAVEPLEYAGFTIPKGTMLFVAACVSHRLPKLFDEPEHYLPDRFAPEVEDPHDSYHLIGFGGGAHRCPGMHFAHLEMKVVISLLLQHLDLELLDPDPQPAPGPKVKWPASPCRVRYRRLEGPAWGT